LRLFGIYSPTLGEREDFPWIFLQKAVTKDNSYVQIWDGELRKAKMRTPELLRTIHTVSSVDTSANTISITGNVVSMYGNGATVTIYDTDDNYSNFTLSTTSTYNSTSTILTVTGNITASTPSDFVFNSGGVASSDPSSTDFRKVAFPDSNPALDYQTLTLSDGTERLIGFTKDHVYYWNTTTTTWTVLHTCASSCTYWDTAKYGDNICATNNVDRPIYWDGNTSNTFENIDTQYTSSTSSYISKAKFIASYHNYIFLGNVELSDGNRYQSHVYTSSIGEGLTSGGFQQIAGKDAGSYYIAGDGEITGGFGHYSTYLCIFKRRSIRKMWFVALSIPFEQSEMSPDIGSIAPGSVGNDWAGDLYYYGTDKAYHGMTAGNISQGIDKTARDVNPSLVENMRFLAVDEYKELRWSIGYGSSATANNKIVVYKPAERRWDTDMDIAVTAFGKYTQQSNYTWDTLPFNSWDEWGWDSWDAIEASSDFPVDICSDADGYTYALHGGYLDDGAEYNSSFVISTDLADKRALTQHKRISQIYVYVQKETSGTLTLSAKRDNEQTWQSLGTVPLTGDGTILRKRLAVDITARHFLIKTLGTTAFRILGFEFEFDMAGFR
jgi:hypothetical protein